MSILCTNIVVDIWVQAVLVQAAHDLARPLAASFGSSRSRVGQAARRELARPLAMPNAPASPPALSTPGHEPEPEPEDIVHTQARLAPCPICKFKNRYMPSDKGGDIWPEGHAPIEWLTTCPVYGPCGSEGAVTDAVLLRMQKAAHEAPPTLWRTIMWSDTLFAGRPRRPPGTEKDWFRWPPSQYAAHRRVPSSSSTLSDQN